MKVKLFKREFTKRSESNRIRREGNIPGVIYSQGKDTQSIFIDGADFRSLLRTVTPGRLSTTVFALHGQEGKEIKAILKDIQYHPTTYQVQHVDFEVLKDDVPVNINVPVELAGVVDCVGVKLGGNLRQVIRSLRVRCLPKHIPAAFVIDVRNMGQNDSKRLSDLDIPQTVRPMADLNEVAVIVAKR